VVRTELAANRAPPPNEGNVWSILEGSLQKLTKPEKARVEKEVAPLGKKVKFLGFDGNKNLRILGSPIS
jgi:hypothetical protein